MSDHTEQQQFVTVESAARSTGISARTLRYWIASGKLTATAERRGKRVSLADVERIARVTGKLSGSATIDPASVPGSATATAAPLPETAIALEANRQLATLREGLVAPLVELTERQQTTITEQAETIGRLTVERNQAHEQIDALHARVSQLETQQTHPVIQASSAPQTGTDAATAVPWWQFWKRS